MVTWDIHYSEAMALVKAALVSADQYQATDAPAFDKARSSAADALTHSEIVLEAVSHYVDKDAVPQLEGVFGHTSSAVQGTAAAINAYSAGQVEMAATAQRNATAAQYPQDMPGRGRAGASRSK